MKRLEVFVGFVPLLDAMVSEHKLTRRERDIVDRLIAGLTAAADISKQLHISEYTVNNHLKSIFEKTGVNSKAAILGVFLGYISRAFPPQIEQPKPEEAKRTLRPPTKRRRRDAHQ